MKNEIKSKRSHIQMPKFLLERFEVNGTYCYYDVVGDFIGTKGHARSTNTETGYYSSESEEELNTLIESQFSMLLYSIRNRAHSVEAFELTDNQRGIIILFANSLIARSPGQHISFNDQLIHTQFTMDKKKENDFALYCILGATIDHHFFDDSIITLLENRTNIPFVLPIKGLYTLQVKEKLIWVLPIDPKTSFVFMHKDFRNRIIKHDKKIHRLFIDNDDQILQCNLSALLSQRNENWGRVVSADNELLIRLREESNKYMDKKANKPNNPRAV